MNHALGTSGAARRVNDRHRLVGRRGRRTGERLGEIEETIPTVVHGDRRVGQAQPHQPLAQRGALPIRPVEPADENRLGLTVFEDVADRPDVGRGIDRHADEATEHQCQVGDKPLGAILGQQRHGVAGFQPEPVQGSGDLPCLVSNLAPGQLAINAAFGLAKKNAIRGRRGPVL